MNTYNDKEFVEKVNTKVGVVTQFRKALKEHNLIGNRMNLTDEHIQLFNNAAEIKTHKSLTWEGAFREAIKDAGLVKRTEITKFESNNLSSQIKGVLKLRDKKVLNDSQALEVIKTIL